MSSRSDTRLYRGHRHRLRDEIRLQCFRSTFGTVTGRATSCVIRQHCSMDAATSLSCRLGPQSGNVSVRPHSNTGPGVDFAVRTSRALRYRTFRYGPDPGSRRPKLRLVQLQVRVFEKWTLVPMALDLPVTGRLIMNMRVFDEERVRPPNDQVTHLESVFR
jgi:hypothetical protein